MRIENVPFMTIFEMPVDEIKTAPFNPPGRTDSKNLKPLLEFLKGGRPIPPIWLSRDGILGDGHRRLACAKQMGLKTILAIRFDLSVEEVWAMNFGTRPISNPEILVAFKLGFRDIPRNKLTKILEVQATVGEMAIDELTKRGMSWDVLHWAKRVTTYCQSASREFLKSSFWWLVYTKQQFMVRKAMDGGISPEVLENAIMNNKKITHNWSAN